MKSKRTQKSKLPEEVNGSQYSLRPHQTAALNSWLENDLQGILALATGAGKTITAIHGITKLYEAIWKKKGELFVIVSVPYQNLAEQWIDELSLFNIDAIPCFYSKKSWYGRLETSIRHFKIKSKSFVCCVVVNKTLVSNDFGDLISQLSDSDNLLFVGDECHHHGAETFSTHLPLNARYRLGLSATPEHYLDEERNKNLFGYYGKVVAEYSLKQAINDKVLTPYHYHVIPVSLTSEEVEKYTYLSAQIAQCLSGDKEKKKSSYLSSLQSERSRLIGGAVNKKLALQALLKKHNPEPFTLFYVGDGRVDDGLDDSVDEEAPRQIEVVTRIAADNGFNPSHFTARESKKQREYILRDFKDTSINSLVAIKCLDEGIDIPACRTAFILASSSNPRQFIQRRGRILRKAKGKKVAKIFDFVVYADIKGRLPAEISSSEEGLIINELKRVAEFAELSENFMEVYKTLRPILEMYGLEGYL